MAAYYNEIDPKAAAWLRELIKQGLIAPGDVDERSIEDVAPSELSKYTQCHFFAGIGVWSYALRLAGWPDDRPVWTGSCPCQPFSCSGKGEGFADERHLWPAFLWHISKQKPGIIFGEQVASKSGIAWIDLVQSDLEREGYTSGAVVFPACGVGAPHMRQRTYWVGELADTDRQGLERHGRHGNTSCQSGRDRTKQVGSAGKGCRVGELADSSGDGCFGKRPPGPIEEGLRSRSGETRQLPDGLKRRGTSSKLANPYEPQQFSLRDCGDGKKRTDTGALRRVSEPSHPGTHGEPGAAYPVNGYWRDADWIGCTDGKFRAVNAGTFPLANESPERVGRLRGYGNAIVAQQAKAFIEACLEGYHD